MKTEYSIATVLNEFLELSRLCHGKLARLLGLLESYAIPDRGNLYGVISSEDGSADALGLAITAIRDAARGDSDRSEAADAVAEFIRLQGCRHPHSEVHAALRNRSVRCERTDDTD